ncbi:class I SAM-dependent methyltransferase [Deltaproteobacteria bacterium TL4]
MNIKENLEVWDVGYDWSCRGEEWSDPWGNSMAQWTNVIYPRIFNFLPTGTVLEIGPGNGRWSGFLSRYVTKLVGVDLSQRCVSACQTIFKDRQQCEFYANDGLRFPKTKNGSIDLVFSFDSLVHADLYIMKSYLDEINRVLKDGGAAFIHHSNLLACHKWFGLKEHERARDVDHQTIKTYADNHGLSCVTQELVNWGNPKKHLIDCFSTFYKGGVHSHDYQLFRNSSFMDQASLVKEFARYYTK